MFPGTGVARAACLPGLDTADFQDSRNSGSQCLLRAVPPAQLGNAAYQPWCTDHP